MTARLALVPSDPIDGINVELIVAAPIVRDPETGRRRILQAGGGYYTRSITGWVFVHQDTAVTVSVPTTLAALEARDAQVVAA